MDIHGYVCMYMHRYTHTHTRNVFLIHAREFRGKSALWGSGWENLKEVRTDLIIKVKLTQTILDFVLNGGFLVFCFAFQRKKNHDLTRIRRRMLNHCELTNETRLHSSKQLPLIHGGDWLHQELELQSPQLRGQRHAYINPCWQVFHTVDSTNSKPYTAI